MMFSIRTRNKMTDHAFGKHRIHLGRKKHMSRLQVKTMLVCSFDHMGIVHYEFIPQGQTANQQCYLEVLIRLRECVQRKRPGLWPDKWILHHDNAPAHDVLRVCEFMAKNSIQKWTIHLIHRTSPLRFLALSKIKKMPRYRCHLFLLYQI
jgi:hypothetical protein